MAVLGTVIGRGTAASKPGSPAEGYVYFSTDTGVLERYSGSAWEVMSGSPLAYLFNTSTSDADPGAGKIAYNNATPGSVTVIYIDDQAANEAVDLGAAYSALVGAVILFHSLSDDGDYILATIDSVTDGTGYWKLGVTIEDSGSLPSANDIMELHIFGGGGGGGGGSSADPRVFHGMRALWCGGTFKFGVVYSRGDGIALSGTADAAVTDSERYCSQWSPTSTAQAYVRVNDTSIQPRHYPDLRFDMKLVDNDDGIFWGGFLDQTTPPGTGVATPGATSAIHGAMVRAKNGTDTNYQFVTSDGTTDEVTDTGVAVDGNWHDFRIFTDDGGASWKLEIDGALVATNSTTVPGTTTGICPLWGNSADTTSSRNVYCSYFYCFQGKSNLDVD